MTLIASAPAREAESFQRRDDKRRETFDALGIAVANDKIVLEDDEFGGLFDTFGFPLIMGSATIGLSILYGFVVSNVFPALTAAHFPALSAGLATTIAIPLTIIAAIRERRKWCSHQALKSIASLDPLTGLMNRRSFSISLDEELDRMARTGNAAAVILFDLDHFKRLNDTFGHGVGDDVLTQIASIAYSELRNPFDRLARWGGEEFVILLHDMTEDTARAVCERLRSKMQDLIVSHGTDKVTVTASFGGSLLRPNQPFTEAFHHADEALYDAKANGRNRVKFRRCLELAV